MKFGVYGIMSQTATVWILIRNPVMRDWLRHCTNLKQRTYWKWAACVSLMFAVFIPMIGGRYVPEIPWRLFNRLESVTSKNTIIFVCCFATGRGRTQIRFFFRKCWNPSRPEGIQDKSLVRESDQSHMFGWTCSYDGWSKKEGNTKLKVKFLADSLSGSWSYWRKSLQSGGVENLCSATRVS